MTPESWISLEKKTDSGIHAARRRFEENIAPDDAGYVRIAFEAARFLGASLLLIGSAAVKAVRG